MPAVLTYPPGMDTRRDPGRKGRHGARWVVGASTVAVAAIVGLGRTAPGATDGDETPEDPLGPALACPGGGPFVEVREEVADTGGGPATPEEELDRFLARELPGLDRRSLVVEARTSGQVIYASEQPGGEAVARFLVDDVGDSWHVVAHATCQSGSAGAGR